MLLAFSPCLLLAGEGEGIIHYYSGKLGFYHPGPSLNDGVMIGADGITEFEQYHVMLSLDVDVYPKQSISIFDNPQPGGGGPPDISDQELLLFPLHANIGVELFHVPDAETSVYVGGGGGYYFYFYSATLQNRSGGLLGGSLTHSSDSKNSGEGFGTIFARVISGKVFFEPRYYFASPSTETLHGYRFTVDPSGFSFLIGLQYH